MIKHRFLTAGLSGIIVILVLAYGIKAPILAALLAGAVVWSVIMFITRKRRFNTPQAVALPAGQGKAVEVILTQAYADIAALEQAAKQVPEASIRGILQRLIDAARDAAKDVAEHPTRLSSVRRLLTYYVPRTGDITLSYAAIANRATVSPEQRERMQNALAHLETTYDHYRQQSVSVESETLDVELDLLARSIKQDVERD